MAENDQQAAPAIAPPLVILICIAGSVVFVILIAVMSRLCRTVRAKADEDLEDRLWNPNKRNKEQDAYMEEVRWRNNAFAWERARGPRGGRDHVEYRRGWLKEQIETRRASEQHEWETSPEISVEEFLSTENDNPYQDMLEQRLSQQPGYSPRHFNVRLQDHQVPKAQYEEQVWTNESGVKITVNDEEDDIIRDELTMSHKFVKVNTNSYKDLVADKQ